MSGTRWILGNLESHQKTKLRYFFFLFLASTFLEILGILFYSFFIGLITNRNPSYQSQISFLFFTFDLPNIFSSYNFLFLISGTLCFIIFSMRSLISYNLMQSLFHYLENLTNYLGRKFTKFYLDKDIESKSIVSSTEGIYLFIWGISASTTLLLGLTFILISDVVIILFLLIPLIFRSGALTIFVLIYFGAAFFLLQKKLALNVEKNSSNLNNAFLSTSEILNLIFSSPREIFISSKEQYILQKYSDSFSKFNFFQSKLNLSSLLPKYVYDVLLIGGVIGIFAIASLSLEGDYLFETVLFFLAVSSRGIPSLLRIQTAVLGIKSAKPQVLRLRQFISKLDGTTGARLDSICNDEHAIQDSDSKNSLEIIIQDLSFKYQNANEFVLQGLNLHLKLGKFWGIKGSSGSGKSTLLDLMIGILQPSTGKIEYVFSDMSRFTAKHARCFRIGYAPQHTEIISGSILSNICFGEDESAIKYENLNFAIVNSDLESLIDTLPDGVHYQIDPIGENLSGGQKQKIGIARALYNLPQILLLDEATSSLDMESEQRILKKLNLLKHDVLLCMVAHRDSALKSLDEIIDLNKMIT